MSGKEIKIKLWRQSVFLKLNEHIIQPYWLDQIGTVTWLKEKSASWKVGLKLNKPIQIVDALESPDDCIYVDRDLCLCDKWTLLRSAGTKMAEKRERIFPVKLWTAPVVSKEGEARWLALEFYGRDADWGRFVELLERGIAMVGTHKCKVRKSV